VGMDMVGMDMVGVSMACAGRRRGERGRASSLR
jgi:hypothetical protein